MDALDKAILVCLAENARMTASAIGKRVSLSVSSVTERIKKLEENGTIESYTVLLDNKAIDCETDAYFEVTLENSAFSESFAATACSFCEVLRCDLIAIEYDYLLFVSCSDITALDALRAKISAINGVRGVKVRLVLHRHKRSTSPLCNTDPA